MVGMRDRLTARQEAFCSQFFLSRNATDAAIKAGYSPAYPGTNCDDLLKSTKIQARLAQLQALATPDVAAEIAIAVESERRKILTEVARHGIEAPVSAGHKIAAVDLLNKMDRLYQDGNSQQPINVVFVVGRGYREIKEIEAKEEGE